MTGLRSARGVLICATATMSGVVASLAVRSAVVDQESEEPPAAVGSGPLSKSTVTSSGEGTDTVTVTTETVAPRDHAWMLGLSHPLAKTSPPAGMDCLDLYAWTRRQGALPMGKTRHAIEIRTSRRMAVEIISIETRLVRTADHKSGAIDISCHPEGYRYRRPSTAPWNGNPTLDLTSADKSVIYAAGSRRTARPGLPARWTFDISASGSSDLYYTIKVDYQRDGVPYRVTLDDDGKPYLLAARDDGAGYAPPAYTFVRDPHRHFSYRPALCNGKPCP